ncbi:hypothetical protein NEPAR03_1955 [Nematocida parisii]|nr:hypothetical protein NEPAR03_1955 [Nematocida parisii]
MRLLFGIVVLFYIARTELVPVYYDQMEYVNPNPVEYVEYAPVEYVEYAPVEYVEYAPMGYTDYEQEEYVEETEPGIEAIKSILTEAMMDSDPNLIDDLLSEAVRIQETSLKDELTVKGGKYAGTFSLTFDGSPTGNTLRLLSILKKYKKNCGFYLDPFNIDKKTIPIVTEILKNGHTIGLSITHDMPFTEVTMHEARSRIKACVDKYMEVIGVMPGSARLPRQGYYSDDIEYCLELGVTVCEPNYDVMDYNDPHFLDTLSRSLAANMIEPTTDCMVLVMRDKYSYTLDSIDGLIELLKVFGLRHADYNVNTGLKSAAPSNPSDLRKSSTASRREELLSMNADPEESSAQKIVDTIENNARMSSTAKGDVSKKSSISDSVSKLIKTSGGNVMIKVGCVGGVLLIVAFFI